MTGPEIQCMPVLFEQCPAWLMCLPLFTAAALLQAPCCRGNHVPAGASCTSRSRPTQRLCPRACCCRRELHGAGSSGAAGGGGAAAEHEPGETLSGQSDSYKDPLNENLHNRGP